MKKKINANVYTEGKFGKRIRETLDRDKPCLYSGGRYLTKITSSDLGEVYIKIHSRVIWYISSIKTERKRGVIIQQNTYFLFLAPRRRSPLFLRTF